MSVSSNCSSNGDASGRNIEDIEQSSFENKTHLSEYEQTYVMLLNLIVLPFNIRIIVSEAN